MFYRILLASCLLVSTSAAALAWDDEGHMIVAAAAFDQLSPQAKSRVAQLLALNAYPTNGINNAKPADAAKAAFMQAATAADAIKRNPQRFHDDGDNAAKAPHAADNVGFNDTNMHRYWHYIDVPFSPDRTPLIQPPAVNAMERIALFRKTLASDVPDTLKAFDLVWLLHLVADVHQPLHATSRFTKDAVHGDNGGNLVKLCAKPCRDDLHAFWDDVPGRAGTVSAAIEAATRLPQPDAGQASEASEEVWIQESFRIAKATVYHSPVGRGLGPYAVTTPYKTKAKAVAAQRLSLAAARLANLLNNELK